MVNIVSNYDVPVVIMHMQNPETMKKPFYNDLINDIKLFFKDRIDYIRKFGILKEQIILDLV